MKLFKLIIILIILLSVFACTLLNTFDNNTDNSTDNETIDMTVPGDKLIFIGADKAIYQINNDRVSWIRTNISVIASAFTNIMDGYLVVQSEVGKSGGMMKLSNNTNIWTTLYVGLNQQSLITLSNGYILAGSRDNLQIRKSVNNADSWSSVNIDIVSVIDFIEKNNIVLAATNNGVYKSIDNGDNWNKSGSLSGEISSVIFLPNGHILASKSSNEGIYKSEDSGATWRKTSALNANYTHMLYYKENIVLAASTVGLIKSEDGGGTWALTTLNQSVNYLAKLPTGEVLSGTDNGLMISRDNLTTWQELGLTGIKVYTIFIDK